MMRPTFGPDGPAVSRLGLGCMSMTGIYGPADPQEAAATLLEALDSGVTMFDTGDFYGDGANEELLGRTLAPHRDRVVLATKTGVRRTAEGLVPAGSPDDLRRACEASLRRLRTDHLDLYYLARVDPAVPVEESVGALADLVAQGKVGHIGLSEVSAATLRRAHAVHPVSAVQTEYSLWERHVEDDILPTIRDLGATLVAYSPLGRGLLTGAVRTTTRYEPGDFRATAPRYTGDDLKANLAVVDAITHIAAAKGATPAQIALAWLLTRGSDVIPIPGSSRRPHLRDNLAALDLHLTATDLGAIDAAVPDTGAQGSRYGDHGIALIDR
ncbi:aldo/keto reductase [Nonomuraea roseoviolacea]|uniref:Aryl-alcohol dehydrogenase-like predicted oxidoreductase n=1 Tax=Nonomuraea roseoviolacea subsp. carminata TaxID=160689 RepID=A0ABT1KCL7_9ACTN|nr:aldo/keto reductase [Nonomuraea roseoviolacea]MCP2351758.1 aryl-alcohol dehydrogenase-like predicted oxidoreductase [Nonomuraea roseoviolacea subsp. carminata]